MLTSSRRWCLSTNFRPVSGGYTGSRGQQDSQAVRPHADTSCSSSVSASHSLEALPLDAPPRFHTASFIHRRWLGTPLAPPPYPHNGLQAIAQALPCDGSPALASKKSQRKVFPGPSPSSGAPGEGNREGKAADAGGDSDRASASGLVGKTTMPWALPRHLPGSSGVTLNGDPEAGVSAVVSGDSSGRRGGGDGVEGQAPVSQRTGGEAGEGAASRPVVGAEVRPPSRVGERSAVERGLGPALGGVDCGEGDVVAFQLLVQRWELRPWVAMPRTLVATKEQVGRWGVWA